MSNFGVKIINIATLAVIEYWVVSYVDDNTIVKSFANGTSIDQMIQSTKQSLIEWHGLLRLTGGDLALEKCKISILCWKKHGYWGDYTMVTKKENNITIQIKTKFIKHQY